MRIDIITVLPEMIEPFVSTSIVGRAQREGFAEVHIHQLRDYATNRWGRIDDYPYGGAAGMLISIEPVDRIISELKGQRHYDEIIFTAPDAPVLTQAVANELSLMDNLIILCGHYKGIDHRIREHLVTREISIGDYVLTGGELAAAIIADATIRLIPGVLGDADSALSDSFQDGLLTPPMYTRPAEYKGWRVPDILLSGHEARIAQWEHDEAITRTKALRPDLLREE